MPTGTVWDDVRRECAGIRAGSYPVTDRRTGRPAGNSVIRADGSGEVPAAVYGVKEGEGDKRADGGCAREDCSEAGQCFEYKPLPADENYLTQMPIDVDVKLKSSLCGGGKFVSPVIDDRQGKAIAKAGSSGGF